MERTVTVRCRPGSAGAEVAGQVVLVMATRAGITPLAADRLRQDVASALASCDEAVELSCEATEQEVVVTIAVPDGAIARMLEALHGQRAEAEDGGVVVRVRRTQLRSV
jgi:hypothetical protein